MPVVTLADRFWPVHAALLAWFDLDGRDLPWRHTREPWPILVSELMLQQTQVSRVIDRWPRFLVRFPTPADCAAAPIADVIDEWSGLGYNRRAVNLHRAAVTVCDRHDGRVPTELADLLALPGIGPYTARAVRVFAYEEDDGVLDTNVARVLARTAGRSLKPAAAQRLATELVPHGDGWRWNQGLFDLGAAFCTSSNPVCATCPVSSFCSWSIAGNPEPDPAIGSAGGSGKQSPFLGSDRQGRGRLVKRLRAGALSRADVPSAMGWAEDVARADRVLETLVSDGLVLVNGPLVSLPN
ncbi:MAG: A/G-specific adenine glycosylase [Acidimicrobiales bacterium]|jgi:A/G-specific adenine glycosylase